MRRYILVFAVVFLALAKVSGQPNVLVYPGGTISSNTTWNGYDYIYITGSVDVSGGGILTIAPNTTGSNAGNQANVYVVFLDNYGINVSNDGGLVIAGTSAHNIYITADRPEVGFDNGDGVYGETGEVWQNLSFNNNSGTSSINYAVIEYGTGDDFDEGGGIDIYEMALSISNTTIRHCSVAGNPGYGGAIYAYTSNPGDVTITNVTMHDNTSQSDGGALYIDGPITATGCTVYSNTAGGSGEGVFFNVAGELLNSRVYNHSGGAAIYVNVWGDGSAIKNTLIYGNSVGLYFDGTGQAVNNVFHNNTTGVTSAAGAMAYVVNSVLWGNGTEYSGSATNLEIGYCAIEGGFTGGANDGGHNINLSSTNTADTGPNFVDPASNNYDINSWISPLVDGGIVAYTGVQTPELDIEGSGRIGPTGNLDIGPYEFFYYRWTGTTPTWSTSANWQGSPASVPTSISENQFYITGNTIPPEVSSITLSSRSRVFVEAGAAITVTGTTTINTGCSFVLQSTADGRGVFKTGSSVSGNVTAQMYLTGGGNPNYNWHYVTPPVDNVSKTILTTAISNNYNLLNFIENRASNGNLSTGWNWHDAYGSTPGFSNLYRKTGYNVYVSTPQTAVFTGSVLNDADVTFSSTELPYSGSAAGDTSWFGWNLIGNPYTADVDAESFTFGVDLEPKIYYTRGNAYCIYNVYSNEATNGAGSIVPAMQGFFVHARPGTGRTLTIPASSRLLASGQTFYKKGSTSTHDYPILKMRISDGEGSTDDAIIYFFNDAKPSYDFTYDAYKFVETNPLRPQIYTTYGTTKLAMNGLPYPQTSTQVPLMVRTGDTRQYSINIMNLENLDDYKVYLVHGDVKTDLKTTSQYTFSGTKSLITNMYVLFEKSSTTGIETPVKDLTTMWYSDGSLMIKTDQTGFETKSSVTLYDLNGKIVYTKTNLSLNRGEVTEVPVNLSRGIYVAYISNGNTRLTKKIAITY